MREVKVLKILLLIALISLSSFSQQTKTDKVKLWQELLIFKDLNLFDESNADKRSQINEIFNRIISEGEELQNRRKYQVLYNVRFIRTQKENIIVVESPTSFMLPGQQIHTIYFFDKNKDLINKVSFTSGWRMWVEKAEIVKNGEIDFPLLTLEVKGFSGFQYADESIQYYALLKNDAVLIYLESSKKHTFENLDNRNYYACDSAIGPEIPDKNVEEWIKLLNSENKIDNLQALMWLAGKHKTVEEFNQEQEDEIRLRKKYPNEKKWETDLERCPEVIIRIKTYEELKNRPDVRERLQLLAKSSNEWIKKTAILALTPIEQKILPQLTLKK